MKSIVSPFLHAVLLLLSLSQVVMAQLSPPVIDRQPYRILYNSNHEPVGEWPPIGISPPRVDASSLVNIGCAIDLRVVASGPDLTYQWKKGTANIPGANGSQLYIAVSSLNDAGLYRCEVTNAFGSVLSMPVRMGVVNIDPSNHFVAAAPTTLVSFSVSYQFPTATGGFKFRWYRMLGASPNINTDQILADGGAYTGATKPLLKIKVNDPSLAGSYYCVVTAYNTYMLTGLRNLAVVPQPAPTMVQLGAPMEFSVTPVGPAHLLTGLSYQWLKEGAEIPDEEASSYAIASATAGDAGLYSVAVTHPTLGTVTTPQSSGLVIDPPVSHVVALTGKTAALIAPSPVSSAQTFQWFRNGIPLTEGAKYAGVTNYKLVVRSVAGTDAGDYECRGTLYGDTVVVARPVLIAITAPQSKVVALNAPLELLAQPNYAGSANVNPALFSYQWVKGSGRSAVLLEGETAAALNIASAQPEDFGMYSCIVDYDGGAEVSSPPASVAVVDTSARSFNVNAGKAAKISPVVYAPRGVSYAWSFESVPLVNGADYLGANTVRLSVLAATVGDAGTYQCEVSYPGGSSVTADVDLVVYSAPEILDIEFPVGIVGGAYSYQIETSDDPLYSPGSYSAKPLPKGLVINTTTGLITGVPTVSGEFDVVVSVKNAVGVSTQTVPLTVEALPEYMGGRFTAPLPRMPAGQFGDLGGRLDLSVTQTAALSGRLTVGALSYAFKGALSVSGTNPLTATATAEILVPRTEGALTLTFALQPDNYLHGGQITGAGNTVPFTGWRAVYSMASPPTALAGRYNVGLFPTAGPPVPAPADTPKGAGYATFSVSGTPGSDIAAGSYSMVGRLADDQAFLTSGFVGPQGELLVYQALYATVEKGSVLGSSGLAINTLIEGNPINGMLSWQRPANVSSRLYPQGFAALPLQVGGGLYAPGDRVLGASQGALTFSEGGIALASRNPDAVFDTGLGDALPVRTAANTALTVFKSLKLAAGSFSGSFSLADDDPTTPVVSALEYRRVVSFKGLVVPLEGEWVGAGFFILPQIPTVSPATTTATSPELSGNLLFEPVVN